MSSEVPSVPPVGAVSPPDPHVVRGVVRRALEEDRVWEDVTTGLLGEEADREVVGEIRSEEPLVVAGLPVVAFVFGEVDASCCVEERVEEGAGVEAGCVMAVVRGRARALLAGERVALNFLQRLCGVATATRRVVEAVRGTGARITDTRKTTPGLRVLEKYAVRVGGGENHRGSLAEAVLFKDNHWGVLGRTGRSLRDVLRAVPRGVDVIVEVETEEQLEEALAAGVDRILVDNQPPERVAAWVRRVGSAVAIEASGGVSEETARAYADAGARFVSVGGLTHSARACRIGLDLGGLG